MVTIDINIEAWTKAVEDRGAHQNPLCHNMSETNESQIVGFCFFSVINVLLQSKHKMGLAVVFVC